MTGEKFREGVSSKGLRLGCNDGAASEVRGLLFYCRGLGRVFGFKVNSVVPTGVFLAVASHFHSHGTVPSNFLHGALLHGCYDRKLTTKFHPPRRPLLEEAGPDLTAEGTLSQGLLQISP